MNPEKHNYQKDLLYDNRQRILLLSYGITGIGVFFLLEQLLGAPGEISSADGLSYGVIFVSMVAGGLFAMAYALLKRGKEARIVQESIVQIGLMVFLLAVAVALTILDFRYGAGLTAYVTVAVLSGLILRNRPIVLVSLFSLSVIAIILGLWINGDSISLHMLLQLILFAVMGIALGILREKDRRGRFETHLQLVEQSIVDPLTDVYNRRFFIEELERTVQRRKRYDHIFCLAIIDVDNFKSINDEFGHLVGDSVLENYAWMLLDHLRESDVVSRYGGDEFMVILSMTGLSDALVVLERLRKSFADYVFPGIGRSISCSIGVVECPADGATNQLIQAADELMYQAKEGGKNRVFSTRDINN